WCGTAAVAHCPAASVRNPLMRERSRTSGRSGTAFALSGRTAGTGAERGPAPATSQRRRAEALATSVDLCACPQRYTALRVHPCLGRVGEGKVRLTFLSIPPYLSGGTLDVSAPQRPQQV